VQRVGVLACMAKLRQGQLQCALQEPRDQAGSPRESMSGRDSKPKYLSAGA
jgi:hypothetical protein